jgi:hypothetical protein
MPLFYLFFRIRLINITLKTIFTTHTSTRLTLANTISGEFKNDFLHAYELSFTSTLETESGVGKILLRQLSCCWLIISTPYNQSPETERTSSCRVGLPP